MRWTLVLRPARRRKKGSNARCGGLHLIRRSLRSRHLPHGGGRQSPAGGTGATSSASALQASAPSPQGEGKALCIGAEMPSTPLISSSRISLSLASAQARKLARSIAPPLPTRTASLGSEKSRSHCASRTPSADGRFVRVVFSTAHVAGKNNRILLRPRAQNQRGRDPSELPRGFLVRIIIDLGRMFP